ncbi:energy transducer TonB [Muricauda sp. CAU 1633]|uniref:energy transducer TonB n=1 Tax=Allomuricauda sp. CAU 1633 TaxID=2816036 RepID=UPI001A8DB4CE|nr:energy transducer TonB [Muricauda sp. CAU 1633]MBO0322754.1 energy transducer TonB [Muricauda sp. CAU 1633]
MELKKNPNLELKRNNTLYFFIGMAVILLLAYLALEWKTYYSTDAWDNAGLKIQDELIEEVPLTFQKLPTPPPKIQAPPAIEIAKDDEEVVETVIESTESNEDTEITPLESIEVAETDEPEIVPWISIENAPVFPGCEVISNEDEKKACFQQMMQKHIQKHFRYPEPAQEMGLQGRVNIIFTIQKDGSIGDVQMRGPHEILEKEAARIISKLPKMTPGKQRGNPVKVPFSIPITFKLH